MLGATLLKLRKKHGYSQQELADLLDVTRQTISNWECDQGAPAIDKARQLAELYQISLDDLVGLEKEHGMQESKEPSRLLQYLVGKLCHIEYSTTDVLVTYENMRILAVEEAYVKVSYERVKENCFVKKETVIKNLALSSINGFQIVKEES